ncbi:MAG TPA: hypothetical protein P5075_08610 [Eubacteriales bacterium]|nr:hypothetical protein [Eubacteriales bacterium]
MKTETAKRVFALSMAVALTLAFGCAKSGAETVQAAETAQNSQTETEQSDSIDYSGIYNVDETEDASESGSYACSEPDENVVLVQNAGTLTMEGADINKLGDASGSYFGGQNAAVAVIAQGNLSLQNSNITTSALGGHGLYAGGDGSVLEAENCYVATAGASSAGLVAMDGAVLHFAGGTLSTEGNDSPCVLLGGGAALTLENTTLNSAQSVLITVLSGECTLDASAQALEGDFSIAEDAFLTLHLSNGSSFTGTPGDELPARMSLTLDASSTWTLTGDACLSVFTNGDATHQNIVSNGFSIYYDSNLTENEALGGQSFTLPGGGFLAPII